MFLFLTVRGCKQNTVDYPLALKMVLSTTISSFFHKIFTSLLFFPLFFYFLSEILFLFQGLKNYPAIFLIQNSDFFCIFVKFMTIRDIFYYLGNFVYVNFLMAFVTLAIIQEEVVMLKLS